MWVGGGHSLLPGEGMSELHFKIKTGRERKGERRDKHGEGRQRQRLRTEDSGARREEHQPVRLSGSIEIRAGMAGVVTRKGDK